jgi:hypothetical protein
MVTTKLRASVFNHLQVCNDELLGPALSLKNLEYCLWIGLASNMSDKINNETEEETTSRVTTSRVAKHNLSRLLKHMDFYGMKGAGRAYCTSLLLVYRIYGC